MTESYTVGHSKERKIQEVPRRQGRKRTDMKKGGRVRKEGQESRKDCGRREKRQMHMYCGSGSICERKSNRLRLHTESGEEERERVCREEERGSKDEV
jgi:hypothetical protein